MHHFYNGLSVPTRTLIDASTGGAILGKNEIEAYQILENIAPNNCQWPTERAVLKKVAGVHDLDAITNWQPGFFHIISCCRSLNYRTLKQQLI